MYERLSRFNTQPGDIKVPDVRFYPSKPVQLQARWLVRMVVDGAAWRAYWGEAWTVDMHVLATSSTEAVVKAESEFFGEWASQRDRQAITLRVTAVMQEAV